MTMGVVQFLQQQEQQTCQASHEERGQGLPLALLFLARSEQKATAFLPAAQSNWLALPCTSVPAVVRVVQREEDG